MTRPTLNCPVAIVGMACRLPGADNLDELWDLVREGRKAFGPVPAERFDRALYYDPRKGVLGKSYTDLGGIVSYPPIDRRLCPLPEDAFGKYDPAHLTLCEVAAAAFRHAGMDPRAIPHRNAGVYVGHTRASGLGGDMAYAAQVAEAAEYLHEVEGFAQLPEGLGKEIIVDVVDQVHQQCPHATPNGPFLGAAMAAGLISRTFGLDGPAMAFNAACASSLHALVQAVRALQLGRIEMAVVGGASYFHSDTLVLFSQAQSVSSRGSFPFSVDADGLVVAEGYVAVVLKTLERAVADGNRVLAVIPRVSIATDGRGKSLWAPRKEGQIEAIRRAYDEQVPLNSVQYIEAHATSTALGDATELSALSEVLSGQFPPGTKIPVGSIKANIGHALESAGACSIAKVVLALQHRVIPPGIDDRPLNKQVDWDRAPVFVPRQEMEWPSPRGGQPRRAGVNTFGIGGMNVHVVVDEFLPGRSVALYRPAVAPRSTVAAVRSPDDQAVAIVGMGAVLPGARTLEAFWDVLASGRDCRTEAPRDRWKTDVYFRPGSPDPWTVPTSVGGFVTGFQYDWRKHKIPPKQIEQASPLQFMILDAVDQAFQQAGYHERPLDRARTGVIVGTIFGGDFAGQLAMALQLPSFQRTLAEVMRRHGVPEELVPQVAEAYQTALLKHMPAILDETGSFTASALASRITKSFDLMGGAVAVDAGTGSSMAALACSIDLLLSGNCDLMICVGAHQAMSPMAFAFLKQFGVLPAGRPAPPFDARSDGVVPGEGCGAVMLKRLADARRDGDRVLGVIRGLGAGYSGSRSCAIQLAVRRALAGSGISGSDVAILETLGTGRAELDAEEIQATLDALEPGRRRQPIQLGTTAGQIGNTAGASGMASLIKATLALEHRQGPAVPGFKIPAPFVAHHRALLQVSAQTATITPANPARGEIAAVSSCGGDEVAYHVLVERGAPVMLTAPALFDPSSDTASPAPPRDNAGSRILFFDATARRREAMRQKAMTHARPVPAPSGNGEHGPSRSMPQARAAATVQARQATSPAPQLAPQPPAVALAPVAAPRPEPAPAKPEVPAAPALPSAPARDAKELETFLVNFVVEQTGYPAEIVELDADLEADLGIDSIKKAQLFGELGQYFDIQPDDNLSLDDFPTLRHVRDYLVAHLGAAPALSAPAPAPQAVALPAPAAPASPAAPARDAKELETFLVNFVVEQTGYPAEIVELDADLEADLGIDSIKKAQLFGELGQYFDIQPDDNLSLDDFPTLRHVRDYLIAHLGATPSLSAPAPAPQAAALPAPAAPASPAAPARDAKELETFLVNFVVEQTGYPAEIVELDADLEADLGIDSIKKAQLFGELGQYFDIQPDDNLSLDDFPTLRHVRDYLVAHLDGDAPTRAVPVTGGATAIVAAQAAPQAAALPTPAAPASPAAPARDAKELETFLVNFVVEQTGYPAEIVELDADLEADLGIDSIKKAQLFGELGQYFDIQPDDNLSLDDFPTLRHVRDYLIAHLDGDAPTRAVPVTGGATAIVAAQAAPVAVAVRSVPAIGDLESFLVNFVVEQTGYPAEIVELDADLEADLGIDSIKKAQLFGELGQYFDIQPDDKLSLDDFPTLRHVRDYLQTALDR